MSVQLFNRYGVNVSLTEQATVPVAPTITSVNSGNGEIFVNFTLGDDGGSPITNIEYRLNGGSWQSGGTITSPLVITGIANGSGFKDINIRAVNSAGASNSSNTAQGRATDRLSLPRYFAIDTDLHLTLDNLTFGLRDAAHADNIHFTNLDTDTPNEPWERIPGNGPAIPGGLGGIFVDHEGNLRCYYELRFPDDNDTVTRRFMALQRSTDGGNTWNYVRNNLDTSYIDDPNSNLILISTPPGLDPAGVSAAISYDPNAPTNERYKALFKWDGGGDTTFLATSSDGLTFSNVTELFSDVDGDDGPGEIFFDTNTNLWTVVGRGRGRGGSLNPRDEGPPKPYEDTRWIYVATSPTLTGTYTIETEVIDPAVVYNYGNEADSTSFWNKFTDSCITDGWEPANSQNAKVRPDFYIGKVKFYHGQYMSLFPTFFKNDERVPKFATRLNQTAGPIYPVWGHSRILDEYGLALNGNQGATGVEGGWKFPDDTFSAVEQTPYLRQNTSSCSSSTANEVGQLMSGFSFDVHNGKIFTAVRSANWTHYERDSSITNVTDTVGIDVHQLTEDRFGRLIAGGTEGSWTTSRINIPGGATKLLINTSGTVQVEILNSITGNPIPGFTKSDSVPITVEGTAEEATWSSHFISELQGQNCRLKIFCTNGSIYAWGFE